MALVAVTRYAPMRVICAMPLKKIFTAPAPITPLLRHFHLPLSLFDYY